MILVLLPAHSLHLRTHHPRDCCATEHNCMGALHVQADALKQIGVVDVVRTSCIAAPVRVLVSCSRACRAQGVKLDRWLYYYGIEDTQFGIALPAPSVLHTGKGVLRTHTLQKHCLTTHAPSMTTVVVYCMHYLLHSTHNAFNLAPSSNKPPGSLSSIACSFHPSNLAFHTGIRSGLGVHSTDSVLIHWHYQPTIFMSTTVVLSCSQFCDYKPCAN